VKTPAEPATSQQSRDAIPGDAGLVDAAVATPSTNIVATTGAALEGPLADIVASAISQLTTVPSAAEPGPPTPVDAAGSESAPRVLRPVEAAAGEDSWTGVPDPALIEIIRRRAAADPLGLKIARRLADSVESIYGERLRGIYMFGIRAAGPADDTADVETLIVLDRVDRYGAELERTSHACAALSHEYSVVVSRVFVSEDDWANRTDGSLPMIRAEAVVA
jgi:hypothetical protein